jgi:hypothetical protein
MTTPLKSRLPVLVAALAATVGTAYGTYDSTYIPAPSRSTVLEPAYVAPASPPAPEPTVAVEENAVTTSSEAPVAVKHAPPAMPVSEPRRANSITITKPRLTTDQRIRADVIDLLAHNPNLSGRIGVVSDDSVVTLTGYTATAGQAWRAGRDARGVAGVRHVVNEIRPRVGAITS